MSNIMFLIHHFCFIRDMKKPALLFALGVCICLTACIKKKKQTVSVQFINTSRNTPYLEYWLQGSKRAELIGYNQNSNSNTADLEEDELLKIEIKDPATSTIVASGTYSNWKAGVHYTFIMYDEYTQRKTTLLSDTVAWPAGGKLKVRFMHLTPDAPALDVFFNNDTVAFNKIYFGTDTANAVADFFTLNAAAYTVRVNNHATASTLLTLPNMGLADNRILDVYASGLIADTISYPFSLGWAAH